MTKDPASAEELERLESFLDAWFAEQLVEVPIVLDVSRDDVSFPVASQVDLE